MDNQCRPRMKYDRRLCFYRCLSVNGERGSGTPWSLVLSGGRGRQGYPLVLSKVPARTGGTPLASTAGIPFPTRTGEYTSPAPRTRERLLLRQGGEPLALTQGDFLVLIAEQCLIAYSCRRCCCLRVVTWLR